MSYLELFFDKSKYRNEESNWLGHDSFKFYPRNRYSSSYNESVRFDMPYCIASEEFKRLETDFQIEDYDNSDIDISKQLPKSSSDSSFPLYDFYNPNCYKESTRIGLSTLSVKDLLSDISIKSRSFRTTQQPLDLKNYEDSFIYSKSSPTSKSENKNDGRKRKKSKNFKGTGTIGLTNIGNTCFMNSILQCLSHSVKLRDYSIDSEYHHYINSKSPLKGKLMKAFADVIKKLWSDSVPSITPSIFKAQIQKFSSRFVGYQQHDSQEFLRFLLDGLHQDINQTQSKTSKPLKDLSHLRPDEMAKQTWDWYGTKDKSYIFDLFVGQLQSSLECLECGHVSFTFDPFWDLSLSLPMSSITLQYGESISLEDCLARFTKEEILEKNDMPTCEKCMVRRKMKKKLLIHRFPEILVIHLKRFQEGVYYKQKLTRMVNFPVRCRLDLSSYSTDICQDKSSTSYELFAVSNHLGLCYSGHYTAYCKNPETKEWHEFDDSRVTSIPESHVCTKQAYLLFYVQKKVPTSND